jgi:hypothetical protein
VVRLRWRAVGGDERQASDDAGTVGGQARWRQCGGGNVGEQRAGGWVTRREKIDLAGGCRWARDFGLSALIPVGHP